LPAGVSVRVGAIAAGAPAVTGEPSPGGSIVVLAADVYLSYANSAPSGPGLRLAVYDSAGRVVATTTYGPQGCGPDGQALRLTFSRPVPASTQLSIGFQSPGPGGMWAPTGTSNWGFEVGSSPVSLSVSGAPSGPGWAPGQLLQPSFSQGGQPGC
jgi:hypothetical protein